MKKNIFLLFAACLLSVGQAMADNRVTVNDVNVPQGGQATIEIGCEFDTEYTGFQLELTLPAGLSLLTDDEGYPVIDKAFDTNHVLTGNLLPSNGNYRFTCRSMDNISIPSSGALFRVTMMADASLAFGTSLPASITACEFTRTSDSQGENLSDVDFTISITESRTILDEASDEMPEAEENANVRVNRTIKANEWSTICLPFDMTETQVKAAFGVDVRLGDADSYKTTEDDAGNVVGINIKFNNVTAIEANHPYIIKVSKDITSFDVDGVDVAPAERERNRRKSLGTGSYFVGNYVNQTEVPEFCLFLSGNKFWYSIGDTQMKAFRGYFDLKDVLTSVEDTYSSRIAMSFSNEETSIAKIEDGKMEMDDCVFDLQGRRMESSMFNSQSSIQKNGVYIVNGKKYVNR